MSENNHLIINPEVAEKKAAAWSKFGLGSYQTEMQLQARAQKSMLSIKLPQKYEDINSSEILLKSLKKEVLEIEGERKKITSILADFSSRLMVPEKQLTESLKALEISIINIKRKFQEEQRKINLKNEEIHSLKLFLQNNKEEQVSAITHRYNDYINEAYNFALNNNISPEEVSMFITIKQEGFNESNFVHLPPTKQLNQVSFDEYKNLVSEFNYFESNTLIVKFEEKFEEKFSDYEVAFVNKELALKKAEDQRLKEKEEMEKQANEKKLSNQLIATAVNVQVKPDIKDLKKSYKINVDLMGDSPLTAKRIIAAYFSNWDKTSSSTRLSKWLKLSISNMIVALETIKNKDNSFNPENILFVEIEKL